ncbi:MAG: CDP-alcohol phosphatidyltransferase family protein [Ignavibacteriae bacterium]|nr:MAG: CDP-alcohol phosphatidyltransferase family protein [Ignavibacteriota bacterium]
MNFPNTLSILRILLSPVFVFLFLSSSNTLIAISFFVFTIAALTDWYDGWYARKYGFKTRWGQFLDPLADKILTSSALIAFYILKQRVPAFLGNEVIIPFGILIAIIILRDIILTLARSYSELCGKEFKTSMISKTKTFIQMTYIFIIIGVMALSIIFTGTVSGNYFKSLLFSNINYYIILIITILTAASGIAYIFESKEPANSKLAKTQAE